MYFSKSHEWIKVEENIGVVGITNYAQKELGDIVYVELPKVGQILKMNQESSILESTKAAADVYSPVSGKVVEVNASVQKNPALVNQEAENSGWLYKLELTHPNELNQLMNLEKYQSLIS